MENYFVITNSDGDTHVSQITKEDLLEKLNENYWGSRVFFDKMPKDSDTNYWGDSVLIIKGEIVAPSEEKVVTQYKID